jgi:hypothetical protein
VKFECYDILPRKTLAKKINKKLMISDRIEATLKVNGGRKSTNFRRTTNNIIFRSKTDLGPLTDTGEAEHVTTGCRSTQVLRPAHTKNTVLNTVLNIFLKAQGHEIFYCNIYLG